MSPTFSRMSSIGGMVPVNSTRTDWPPTKSMPRFSPFTATSAIEMMTRMMLMAEATLRSEEHTSELQSLMRISYAVFCLKKKKKLNTIIHTKQITTNTNNSTTQQTDIVHDEQDYRQ